jgi:hypothetical protein
MSNSTRTSISNEGGLVNPFSGRTLSSEMQAQATKTKREE